MQDIPAAKRKLSVSQTAKTYDRESSSVGGVSRAAVCLPELTAPLKVVVSTYIHDLIIPQGNPKQCISSAGR